MAAQISCQNKKTISNIIYFKVSIVFLSDSILTIGIREGSLRQAPGIIRVAKPDSFGDKFLVNRAYISGIRYIRPYGCLHISSM
jgi:hypothetical protein